MKQELLDFIDNSKWIFAKTYAGSAPHEYLVRQKVNNDKVFDELITAIRQEGKSESFWNKVYIYFYYKGHKYWTMGAPIKETIIINRAKA